jgi:hypothetical protein
MLETVLVKYGYLTGSLLLLIIWLVIFYFKRDSRKEILTLSILAAILNQLEYCLKITGDRI